MEKQDPLFLLIKSMTKAEKRYFKIEAEKFHEGKDKNYLALFKIIENHEVYDEKAIRKNLKNESFLKGFRDVKSYLQRQIMKSLRNFNDEASERIKLNGYLSNLEILYEKKLYRNCVNTIKKAKAYAVKHEKFSLLLELINWEKRIAVHVNDVGQLESLLPQWNEEVKSAQLKYDEMHQLQQIFLEYRTFFVRKGSAKTKYNEEFFQKLFSDEIIKKPAQTFGAELRRLMLKANYILSSADDAGFTEKYSAINDVVRHYESHPYQIAEHTDPYFASLIELIYLTIQEKKFGLSGQLFKKAESIYQKSHDKLNPGNNLSFLRMEAHLMLRRGEYPAALVQVQKIEGIIKIRHLNLDEIQNLLLYGTFFSIYFCNKDFKRAQYYIQSVINYKPEIREDLHAGARIANLILQYEQREYEHLAYALRSTYRYLAQKQRLQKLERVILDFIRKALRFSSEKQMLSGLDELKNNILSCSQDDFTFDLPIIEWIESKLTRKEMAEIEKEKYLKAIAVEE